MSFQNAVLLFSAILSFIIILTVSYKSKHFFKSIFLSAFSGVGALFAISVLSFFTPVNLPVNLFTVSVSAVSGIPGVIALLIFAVTV